jgi:hypothetical protein
MPPKYVKTIQDELYYEYAKLFSGTASGEDQKNIAVTKYEEFKKGQITISDTIKEWQRMNELPRKCVFCGSADQLQTGYLIPLSRGGSESADNAVLSCAPCINSRNDKGIYQWLGLKDKEKLHKLVAGKYLKQLFDLHLQKGTLSTSIEYIGVLCTNCKNPSTCEKWNSVGDLTCFCLESVF